MNMNKKTPRRTKPKSRSLIKKEKSRRGIALPEKLFMLAIDDERGTLSATDRATLCCSLAGALLAELALANRLRLKDGRLVLTDPTPLGDPLYDQVLGLLASVKKPHKLNRWLEAVGGKGIIRTMATRLAERRVIRMEKKHYRWVVPYETHPRVNASAKYWIKQQLRSVVLAGGPATASDLALLSLIKTCQLSRLLFTRDERKFAIRKVEQLVQGDIFGETVAATLSGIVAATAAAVVAAGGAD
jgi:hypothetical protein